MIKSKKEKRNARPVAAEETTINNNEQTITETPETPVAPVAPVVDIDNPEAPTPTNKRGRKASEKPVEPVSRSGKRGRPMIDRKLMQDTLVAALHDIFPNEVFFTRKQLASLGLPISYILYFVEVAKTPVRGLYVLPPSWRNQWPGYSETLKSALLSILKGS